MLGIVGISLGFIGSAISVIDVVLGSPLNDNWEETRSKKYTVVGISLIAIGFLLQLISAINNL